MSVKQGTQVIVRVRPLNERERATTAQASCLDMLDGQTLLYTGREAPANNSFGFDAVLGQETTQAEAFEARMKWERALAGGQKRDQAGHCHWCAAAARATRRHSRSCHWRRAILPRTDYIALLYLQGLKDTVRAVLAGYNGTILAYGQTVGA